MWINQEAKLTKFSKKTSSEFKSKIGIGDQTQANYIIF